MTTKKPAEKQKTKKKTGRKPISIDEKMLEQLASICCTMEEMAIFFGCSVDTLERRFAEIIKKGQATAKISLRRKMFHSALEGNTTALIFMGKNFLGMKDRPEGDTQQVDVVFKVKFGDEE